MSCSQTLAGIASDCSTSIGGIVGLWIANHDDVETKTVTDEIITEIGMAETSKFKRYALKRGTGSMTSTRTIDAANGTNFVSTALSLVFLRMETSKRIEMEALSRGDFAAIVKDANGKYWFLGYDQPLIATEGTGNTGTASSDGNNYQITLTDEAQAYPYEVAESALKEILD